MTMLLASVFGIQCWTGTAEVAHREETILLHELAMNLQRAFFMELRGLTD